MFLWPKRTVKPVDTWKAILRQDIQALYWQPRQDEAGRVRAALREQTLSLHCWQAEEYLNDADLASLKQALNLTDHRWQTYKAHLHPHPF